MRLLSARRPATGNLNIELEEFPDVPSEQYAILSHTWEREEVSLNDLNSGLAENKQGFQKIKNCCAKALDDGFRYTWIDTCCIDKTSSAELSEAINSMYRWYQESSICYVYLADVQSRCDISSSRWFTRGWTLQELIAPPRMIFLNKDWKEFGTKKDMHGLLSQITGIPSDILTGTKNLESISIAQRMSWAARRVTTRVEDQAYSLLGIFGINMPLIYGEEKRSFIRLQEEILRVNDDQSIFAWKSPEEYRGGLFASSPRAFKDSANIVPHNAFTTLDKPVTQSNKGVHLELRQIGKAPGLALAILNCIDRANSNLPIAIYLRDLFMTMERFERVRCTELAYVDLRGYKFSQYPMRRICVKQRRQADLKQKTVSDVEPDFSDMRPLDGILNSMPDVKMNSMDKNREILGSLTERGDFDAVWLLLTWSDFDPERKDSQGKSLLSQAAKHGHVPIVKLLLARGNVEFDSCDQENRTPLSFAASAGHVSVIQILLETNKVRIDSRDNQGLTPLAWAAKNGHEKAVQSLLKNGAYIESEDDWGWTPLLCAAWYGKSTVVSCLLAEGADSEARDNNCGWTPLLCGAVNGHDDVVQQLLAKNVNLAAEDKDYGWTSLSWAAVNGHYEVVRQLLAKGANINTKDSHLGRTPLSLAAGNGHDKIVQLLVSKDADIESKDCYSGRTPLAWAAGNGHQAVVQRLMVAGADTQSKDDQYHRTPAQWAACNGHEAVARLFPPAPVPRSILISIPTDLTSFTPFKA
ncbi:hypothetical protein CBS147346_449 [Aspergillus niger]|nr:hypothetical protein CBS147346_449 [Aspergillus niger]